MEKFVPMTFTYSLFNLFIGFTRGPNVGLFEDWVADIDDEIIRGQFYIAGIDPLGKVIWKQSGKEHTHF